MSFCNLPNDTGIPEDTRTWGENHLESDNPYRIIGEQLFSFISCDELASMYSDIGRPSINPVILSLVTVFQFLENVPDRVAALWVKIRLDWKYALHLPLHDPGFHYSDLCNFRKRLSDNGEEALIFDQLLKKVKSLGFLRKRKYQRTDSTHVLAMVCDLSRLENLSYEENTSGNYHEASVLKAIVPQNLYISFTNVNPNPVLAEKTLP